MPAISARPLVGWTRPHSIRIVVVLPAPFAPRKPKIVPGAIVNDRSQTASVSPYDLLRRSRRMAGSLMENNLVGRDAVEPFVARRQFVAARQSLALPERCSHNGCNPST